MDITRHLDQANQKPWYRKKWVIPAALVGVLGSLAAWTSTFESALPQAKSESLYIDTVKRGELVVEVRAPGNLVPIDKKWLSSRSEGLVRRVHLLSGAVVAPTTLIVELENPELMNRLSEAELALRVSTAEMVQLKEQLANDVIVARSRLEQTTAELKRAQLDLEAYRKLAAEGIMSRLDFQRAELNTQQLQSRYEIDKQYFDSLPRLNEAKLNARTALHAQATERVALCQDLVDKLRVTAGVDGVLQKVEVEEGQRLAVGTIIASVSRLDALKAELRIEEGQAREIAVGQSAVLQINGATVPGKVSRISGAVQSGTLAVDVLPEGPLPTGARPDLRVDGTIRIDRLPSVLFVGKPVQLGSTANASLFVVNGRTATRRQIRLGKASASTIQVLSGLNEGEKVILSDVSAWAGASSIEIL
jgi:HlyD family secretion protein